MDLLIDSVNLSPTHKAASIYRYGALNYSYVCCHCKSQFTNITDILDHIETHFDDEADIVQDNFEINNTKVVESEFFDNHERVEETSNNIQQYSSSFSFKCELCDQNFESQDDLNRHLKVHVEHCCKFCHHVYYTADKLLTHLVDVHLDVSKLLCCVRGCISTENLVSKTKLQNHLLNHIRMKDIDYVSLIDEIISKCENCDEICVKLVVEECLPNSYNDKLLECDICSFSCNTKNKLSLHMKEQHIPKQVVAKRGMYMCDKCNRNIQGKLLFYAHQYEHLTGGNKFDALDDVSLLDNLKSFLDANIQFDEVTPETPYGCKICCHLSVKRRKNIETHILQEHVYRLQCKKRAEKRYPCQYCGKKFTLSHNMIVHKRIHTLERPYKCPICGKSFSHSSYMKYHEKVHSGIRSHQCATCGLSFKSNTKLNMHIKVHSTETTKCPICSKEFKPHRLNVHIKHVHENQHRPYKCIVCSQAFKTSKTLKTHSYRHSGEKKYKCRFHCNERFTSTAGRRGHERSKHETH